MVDVTTTDVPTPAPPTATTRSTVVGWLPGLAVVAVIATVATLIGHRLTLLGGPVAGILLGGLFARPLRSGRQHGARLAPGIKFASGRILQFAVVLLGTQLSVAEVARVGLSSLPVMLGTLAVCLTAAYLLGRALGIDADLRTLIGVGTAICGASAIAAVSPVIKARGTSIAYAISTIFCFNIAAVLLFPPLGHLLGMSQQAFGLFAGTAVNDTSSVVAAATTYGAEATNHAVVVKLVRTLMIIPVCLVLAALMSRRSHTPGARASVIRLIPWFLVGFVLVVVASSLGAVPVPVRPGFEQASIFCITMALTAIGLSIDVSALRKSGARPILLGAALWLLVSLTSLLLQWGTL